MTRPWARSPENWSRVPSRGSVEPEPHIQWVNWPGHEIDHLPASNAEVKNVWNCLHSTILFMAHCLTECRGSFAFTTEL